MKPRKCCEEGVGQDEGSTSPQELFGIRESISKILFSFLLLRFINVFIFGCARPWSLHTDFLSLRRTGAALCAMLRLLTAVASRCRAWALSVGFCSYDIQA